MISVDEALQFILDEVTPLEVIEQPVGESVGYTLTETIVAETPLPLFDNSAMDGYAIRIEDVSHATPDAPVWLRIVGEVPAGSVFETSIHSGEAVKIMTGAQIPSTADAVVMLEKARLRDGQVEIREPVPAGKHIRRRGEDVSPGEAIFERGTTIRLQHLGLLASLGRKTVRVYRAPSVAVLTTGSELIGLDEPLTPGKIYNTNSLILQKLLERTGVVLRDLGVVADDPGALKERIRQAMASDLLIVSGGVSVGQYDCVKDVLRSLGMKTIFWRVNMKPGKPIVFGRLNHQWVFGLPGNPISCVVAFLIFVQTAIQRMMGHSNPKPLFVQAVLREGVWKQDGRRHFLTGHLEELGGQRLVTPTEKQGSGMLQSLAEANAFIVIPEERNALEMGEPVEVLRFGNE